MISKKCLKCESIHSLHDFPMDRSKKDQKSIYCRNCHRKILRQRRATEKYKEKRRSGAHKWKEYNRDFNLKKRYGISLEEYNTMFSNQNMSCKICGIKRTSGKNFVVDHSHKTGKIRGILCNLCNVSLGSLKEDIELIKNMIKYLGESDV